MTKYFAFERIRNITATIAAATLLSGCLSDEEAAAPIDVIPTQIGLSGSVGDGPVVGSNMSVRANDGALLAEFQSDSSAGYNITVDALEEHYPITIDATGGTDLVTNSAPDFDMSSAVFESGVDQIANVNPFSTLAVELARQKPGGLTLSNLEAAQRTVSNALNSGLNELALTGPIGTRIDETNVAEIVRAAETVAELVRRTRDLLQANGVASDGNQLVRRFSSDLIDEVIDGVGGGGVDRRTAAVATIVHAQVLLESMANELHVNGSNATSSINSAIDEVSPAPPTVSTEQLVVTAQMIATARIGLAAAYAVDANPAVMQLHTAVSAIQPGQNATLIRVALPADYRTVLQSVLSVIAGADVATIDIVNAIARGNGDIDAPNLAPSIQGIPATSVAVGADYSFAPTASDVDGDVLTFSIVDEPSWSTFDSVTGQLTGTPASSDVGSFENIAISVTDGEFTTSLPAFTITVVATGNAAPQISGSAPTDVSVGASYSFTPTASDPDGDTLTFSISGSPSWASFNASTGELSGIPGTSDVGSYANIVISVTDGVLTVSLPAFTISVNATNSAPQISGVAPADVNVDEDYTFIPTASDADGDTLTFSVSGLPSWANFDTATGQISGTPAAGDVGTYSNISITVSDGQASATLGPFTITVQAISLGSVTLDWTAPTLNEDGSALTDLAGYKIHWGPTLGNYPDSVTINNPSVTTTVVDNLTPGTYVFVATSFNSAGIESRHSGALTKVVP